MIQLPMTGQPLQVLPMLVQVLSSWVNRVNVRKFYVGRSADPDNMANVHKCDAYAVLYDTSDIENAMTVEDSLIKSFCLHPKCCNEAMHSSGGIPEEDGSLVYVAFWMNFG